MTIHSFSIATSLALIALCGCSGSTSSGGMNSGGNGPGPSTPVAPPMLGSALADAYCPAIAMCCSSAAIAFDVAACSNTLRTFADAQVQLIVGDPKIGYDAAAAGRCVAAYRATASACTDRALSDQINQACDKVFLGTVPPGGSCASSDECVSPAAGYVSCDTAICVVHTDAFGTNSIHVNAGEPCSATCSGAANNSSCSGTASTGTAASGSCWVEDGLYCGTDNTCQASPKIGQSCGSLNYCEAAAHCQAGTCVADTATGECTYSDGCIATSYCDSSAAPFHCVPRKGNGEACNGDAECGGGQCEQDHCRNWSFATQASCAGILD